MGPGAQTGWRLAGLISGDAALPVAWGGHGKTTGLYSLRTPPNRYLHSSIQINAKGQSSGMCVRLCVCLLQGPKASQTHAVAVRGPFSGLFIAPNQG